jgi:large subunit ribosomal protein L19
MVSRSFLDSLTADQRRKDLPSFQAGDTVRIHARITEGSKERVQVFEGIVIKRSGKNGANATFTVRKVSYNIGVERTFLLHSPKVDRIEVVGRGSVRRSRLFYLRPLRGKASRIKSELVSGDDLVTPETEQNGKAVAPEEAPVKAASKKQIESAPAIEQESAGA